ncbi:putative zinc finger BED domain-containing protein 1-like [Ditylenchus destructor]|uniref:Zinc finger BED domain-containing protein 1-like n=1 Tax=Ditylenchus destructor TaxID=166010 RepID=A0AAD4MNW2_9BILA|nr:putative zinc finger BED domain-containing protein 1-like [Ditylenchus destructor]
MMDNLTKFVVTANLSMSVVENPTFLSFLESFQNLAIDNSQNEIPKAAKDLIPSKRTVKNRILADMGKLKGKLLQHIQQLNDNAHYISDAWEKINFIILFSPLAGTMKKTTKNIQQLILEDLSNYGITSEHYDKFFITTDEGSNVLPLGGKNHVSCLAHIGSTFAKRTTNIYRYSTLDDDAKLICSLVNGSLAKMQKCVGKLKEHDKVMTIASKALKFPVETRYLSHYNMINSAIQQCRSTGLDFLKSAYEQCQGLQELSELIAMIENEGCFKDYLTVLKPIYEMVKEVQEEKEPTSSKILLHIANIWLKIMDNISQQNPYINSLSQATQHAFIKKIGNLADLDWLKITHFNVNVAVTAAFLDPLVHSQLPYLCDIIPAFDYEQMKEIVHKPARPFISQWPPSTSTKKKHSRKRTPLNGF